MSDIRKDTGRIGSASRLDRVAVDGMRTCLATLVLAWATGVPLHSAENVLPHAGRQTTPYLGV